MEATQDTVGRTRPWLLASAAAMCWGIGIIVVLHVISSHNPALDTLSSYAFTDRGTGMLAMSILAVSVGSLTVLGALTAARVPISGITRALFYAWSGGLALAATFPASYKEFPNPVSGEIHQYSCLLAFLSAPAIGRSILKGLGRSLPARRVALNRWTLLSSGSLILFGVSYLLSKFPSTAMILPVGVTQRVALTIDLVLLCSLLVLAATAASVHSGSRTTHRAA
jgi:hypothetical protein